MAPSLKQNDYGHSRHPPITLEKWAGPSSTPRSEQENQRVQDLVEARQGRYLYPDNIFQEQDAAQRDGAARWLRTVRAGDLEIDGRTIGAGFVKLSEEEMEKRRKDGACFKCNKKGHYS